MCIIIIITIKIIHLSTCGKTKMASKKVNICRFCNSAVAPSHSTQLFSTKSLSINLAVMLRTLVQLPVNADDSPNHSCRPCMQSFPTAEKFTVTAKVTGSKVNQFCVLSCTLYT